MRLWLLAVTGMAVGLGCGCGGGGGGPAVPARPVSPEAAKKLEADLIKAREAEAPKAQPKAAGKPPG